LLLTTPTDSLLFLILSLLIIAASLYLPEHLLIIANRMFYYFSGDASSLPDATVPGAKPQFTDAAAQFLASQQGGPAGPGRGFMEP
jgi:hypothetical protein